MKKATAEEIEAARQAHQCADLEIDDDALVSPDDEKNTGYWVSAWVWVNKS